MKSKFKKLSFVVGVALLLLAAGPPRSAFAECTNATTIDISLMVAVSTTITQPTQIFAGTSNPACVQIMPVWSGSGTKPNAEFLLMSASSTPFSSAASTGTLRIPAGNSVSEFLMLGDYRGPLWGVITGTTAVSGVAVMRKK